ncbi:MAG TPA: hypothetical protein VG759_26730 [Candidatus Angelobacter sp.]|jgi:hypothetical protein|nr:hypothetical protein [Candidatus Angelobacter sp.]
MGSQYYYVAMFFIASVAWMFVKPRHVIVYSPEKEESDSAAENPERSISVNSNNPRILK